MVESPAGDSSRAEVRARAALLVLLGIVCLSAVRFSQRPILIGDGYHVLAAQLVAAGRMPYRDFFLQQMPLYQLICGAWMAVFGSGWRVASLLNALLLCGSALVLVRIAQRTYGPSGWGTRGSILALALFGLNYQVVMWALAPQPFALCMFFCVAAWEAAFGGERSGWRAVIAGAAAGAAVNTSLLALPFLAILAAAIARRSPGRQRAGDLLRILFGVAAASLPFGFLAAEAPAQVWFQVVEYHLFHRMTEGPWYSLDVIRNYINEILGWSFFMQDVLLVFLSLAYLPLLFERAERGPMLHSLRFAAVVVVGWALFLCVPHPTFYCYFVLLKPGLCLLAPASLWAFSTRVWPRRWVSLMLGAIVALYALETVRPLVSPRRPDPWAGPEQIAREISSIPGPIYTTYVDIYVAARRLPPHGLENNFARAVHLPRQDYERAGIVSPEVIEAQLREGRFAALVLLKDDGKEVDAIRAGQVYTRLVEVGDYVILTKPKG